jgi:hypothetical protein
MIDVRLSIARKIIAMIIYLSRRAGCSWTVIVVATTISLRNTWSVSGDFKVGAMWI